MTDLIFLIGVAAVVTGCAILAPWLAFIVGGTLAILYAAGRARGET